MATLDSDFEDSLREAVLDDIQQQATASDGYIQTTVAKMDALLAAYGRRHDYDVGPVIESRTEPAITRDRTSIRAFWGYYHPAARPMAFGTSDHTVDGDPVLTFVWEDPPQWVTEEFEQEGDGYRVFFSSVDVSGLPAGRFVRDGLADLRRRLQR